MWILQTTWDRPGLDGETNEALLNDSVESSERSDQSDSVGESDDEYGSVENALPPNWIGKEPLILKYYWPLSLILIHRFFSSV